MHQEVVKAEISRPSSVKTGPQKESQLRPLERFVGF